MTRLYEVYDDTVCPRCGCTQARDLGPYEPSPFDAALGGPPDPVVHQMVCHDCRKPYDVAPDWYVSQEMAAWEPQLREQVAAEHAITDAIRALADGTWDGAIPSGPADGPADGAA